MEIAVIIPLYNGARWIERTLQSVFEQSLKATEIMVVDDGSSDASVHIVQGYPSVTVHKNPGKGTNQARSFGLSQITAPVVTFLDQDDIWHPDHLRTLSGILAADPTAPAVVGRSVSFRQDHQLRFTPPNAAPTCYDPWKTLPITEISTPSCVLIRRDALDRIGGWPTKYKAGADLYTWLALAVERSLVLNRSITVGYRSHHTSFSAQLIREGPVEYIERVRAALIDVVVMRLAAQPQDKGVCRRRLDALNLMVSMVGAITESDGVRFYQSALALERCLEGDENVSYGSAWHFVMWFVQPALNSVEKRDAAWSTLLDHWPAEASGPRSFTISYAVDHAPKAVILKRILQSQYRSEWLAGLLGALGHRTRSSLSTYRHRIPVIASIRRRSKQTRGPDRVVRKVPNPGSSTSRPLSAESLHARERIDP
jgi:glycosyltransferase involved in cell wall biosynthesis